MGQSAQSTRQPFLARLRRFASPFPSTVATPAPTSPNSTEGLPCLMPDTETSASEEPGARKGHAGICAGAAWATSRPTALELNIGQIYQNVLNSYGVSRIPRT